MESLKDQIKHVIRVDALTIPVMIRTNQTDTSFDKQKSSQLRMSDIKASFANSVSHHPHERWASTSYIRTTMQLSNRLLES